MRDSRVARPQRIYIIGGGGSGKTTLGRQVASARHLRLTAAGANPHPGWRLLWQFLRAQRRYYTAPAREPAGPTDWDAITRAATARLVQGHEAKVVVLRSPREVRRWRRAFCN